MGTRRDRVALPLISNAGGVIVNPSIQIKCAYGDDGSTWRAPGGCYDHWCDPNNPWQKGGDANGGKPCGFGPRDKINHAVSAAPQSALRSPRLAFPLRCTPSRHLRFFDACCLSIPPSCATGCAGDGASLSGTRMTSRLCSPSTTTTRSHTEALNSTRAIMN